MSACSSTVSITTRSNYSRRISGLIEEARAAGVVLVTMAHVSVVVVKVILVPVMVIKGAAAVEK